MSNIIDVYCVYRCSEEIRYHTEETKHMTSNTSYINRKRYSLLQKSYITLCVKKLDLQYITKSQLISKCPYEKSVSSKIPTKLFLDFCPEIFCSFLGASWKLFGLPGDLVSNIINEEGYGKSKKLPGSPQKATKNFRAEIQKYFCWYFG